MKRHIHTSNRRQAERLWLALGGIIECVRRTGERRYRHPCIPKPLTSNGRRCDVPMKLLAMINRLQRKTAGGVVHGGDRCNSGEV